MEFLRELFTEPLSYEAFEKLITDKGIKLANVAGGAYIARNKFDELDGKLKSANQTIKTMTDEMQALKDSNADAADWKKKFEDLQKDNDAKEEQAKKEQEDKELTEAIEAVFGDKKFTSDYVRNGVIADMKAEIAKPENKGKGYSELFESLTNDKEGIFASENPGGQMSGITGGGHEEITDAEIRAIMGIK